MSFDKTLVLNGMKSGIKLENCVQSLIVCEIGFNLIKMLLALLSLLISVFCVICHQNPNFQEMVSPGVPARGHVHASGPSESSGAPKGLWDQYGRNDFLHDLKYYSFVFVSSERWSIKFTFSHLKEEANKLLYMQESDQISSEQSAFYYTRLHDFNSDAKLDGLGLLAIDDHCFHFDLIHRAITCGSPLVSPPELELWFGRFGRPFG